MEKLAASFSESIVKFTFDVYKKIASDQLAENAFLSSSSILIAMDMLEVGAKNETNAQILKVLSQDNIEHTTLLSSLQAFTEFFKGGCSFVDLTSANKIYPRADKHIVKEYLEKVKTLFKADIKRLDYKSSPEESRSEINHWVEKETNGKIKDILASGSVTSHTMMIVVNAIYFKGQWNEQFSETATRTTNFFATKEKEIQVEMMGKTFRKVKYTESGRYGCKALLLPYRGMEQGMIILLPNDIEGLYSLESRLSSSMLEEIMRELIEQKVVVNLPKFQMDSSYEMKDVLTSLGMCDLFDAEKSDLSGIGEGLYVTNVVHKAFIDVNEEGTEAAAATATIMAPTCAFQHIPMFIANHPFLFIIWDHRTQVPLFIGRLVYPK